MKQSGLGGRARSIGWKLALAAAFTPGAAWAQDDCQEDADCGHGFRCLQTSANSSSVTGSGGSTQVECGDGICEGGVEDPDSCPTDCDTISYCAPAECDSNADCAEGYECGEEVGANSGFTSAGGSTASVCGDDTCDIDENNDNCAEDCPVFRYCQPEQTQCSSDDDCAEGFYCYLESGTNDVGSVSVSSVDSGTNGTDTATDGSSGSSDSDADSGSDGADSGFAPPADTTGGTTGGDETGVCVAESSDAGSSSGNSGSSNNTASGPTDSSATGDDTSSSAGNDSGSGGASAVGGEGSPSSGSGSDSDTASDGATGNATGSDGGGAGGSDPDAGGGDDDGSDDGGCSCAVVGVPASSGFLGALLFGMVAGIRRRRTRS